AKEMVDAIDGILGEDRSQDSVQLPRAGEVVAERLLHDDPAAALATALAQPADDGGEQLGREGEVVYRAPGGAERGPQGVERPGVVVVAVDVADERQEPLERIAVLEAAGRRDALR